MQPRGSRRAGFKPIRRQDARLEQGRWSCEVTPARHCVVLSSMSRVQTQPDPLLTQQDCFYFFLADMYVGYGVALGLFPAICMLACQYSAWMTFLTGAFVSCSIVHWDSARHPSEHASRSANGVRHAVCPCHWWYHAIAHADQRQRIRGDPLYFSFVPC
jgi:hypothetical protein